MSECVHCGGSGVLNIISASMGDDRWDDRPYVSPCHCSQGNLWKELGLG